MRKKYLIIWALIVFVYPVLAQSEFTVNDIEISQGGQGSLAINFCFSEENKYQGYQFDLTLPEGITLVTDNENATGYDCAKGACHSPSHSLVIFPIDNTYGFVCYSGANALFSGTSGQLLSLFLHADPSISIGTENLIGTVSSVKLGYTDTDGEKSESLNNTSFNISIVEPRILLDEMSTLDPESGNSINVKVKRTIKANQWNTICLPFSMTEAQVKTAFGNDVELADFDGCETTSDDEDNITSISVNFVPSSSIEANHPYIIKVSNNISEFDVNDVDVIPEDEPSVDKDEMKVKVGKITYSLYNRFVGTYKNVTLSDIEYVLFLNGGSFWYAPSQLTIKGFRGYFDFYDVLASAENQSSGSLVNMRIIDGNGKTTVIDDVDFLPIKGRQIYTVNGLLIEEDDSQELPQGFYIIDGEKVFVK